MKILIAVPSSGIIKAKTAFALVQAAIHAPCEVDIAMELGCNIVANRQKLVDYALANSFDAILFVDSDMFFPPDIISRLLSLAKDIVGVDAKKRSLPLETTVKYDGELPAVPFKARAVGTGVLFIRTSVFEKLERPWFSIEYDESGQAKTSEDVWFCKQAQKAGHEIWCDPTIFVKHIGDYLY